MAALRIGLDPGIAAALRDSGLVALRACLSGPDNGSNTGMSRPDSLGVAAKAVRRSPSPVQVIGHGSGIGASGCRLLLPVSDVASAGNRRLLAHHDVGLGTHGLDISAGLHLSVGLFLDLVTILLEGIAGSAGQSWLSGEWLDVLEVVEERGAAAGSVSHGPHLVLQVLQLYLLSHHLDLLLKLELVVAQSGRRLSSEGVGLLRVSKSARKWKGELSLKDGATQRGPGRSLEKVLELSMRALACGAKLSIASRREGAILEGGEGLVKCLRSVKATGGCVTSSTQDIPCLLNARAQSKSAIETHIALVEIILAGHRNDVALRVHVEQFKRLSNLFHIANGKDLRDMLYQLIVALVIGHHPGLSSVNDFHSGFAVRVDESKSSYFNLLL